MNTVINSNRFSYARLTLTLWYCAILFFILGSFSLVLYSTETRNFTRVVLQRNFGTHVPGSLSSAERKIILVQVAALRRSFTFNLLFIDLVILFLGGGLSYFLAGQTLQPISETLKKQKEFLADASHEFRTPLAAIQTACEVALRSPHKTKEDYKQVIAQAYEESIRLGKIADELLLLSRIDSGIAMLDMVPSNISDIFKKAVAEVKPLIEKKQLTLHESIDEGIIIQGDKNKLKQLCIILLDNAIKYTPANGILTVTLISKPRPTMRISDTGIGIEKKEQEQIFDRFYQSDISRSAKGAGLGLSIAKWIADQHHATITVQSAKNKGSTFSIIF